MFLSSRVTGLIKWPSFDVDFQTTCDMNAKNRGATSIVTLDTMLMLKPTYKGKR